MLRKIGEVVPLDIVEDKEENNEESKEEETK